jgi:rhodanese-like protein
MAFMSNLHFTQKEIPVPRHVISVFLVLCALTASAQEIPNPLIDYAAFQQQVLRVGQLRATRRVSEYEFIRMAADPQTIVLDARSAEKFAMLHVKGARNLSLPDMTEQDLAQVIPSKSTRILIYCNNNFLNQQDAFRSKVAPASLNIHTFNALYAYGYTNVYELGPLLDIRRTLIPFEGQLASY